MNYFFRKNFNNKPKKIKQEVRVISLTSMFLSMSLIFKFLGQFIPITGFPLEIELIIFSIGLLAIDVWKYKLIFLVLAPLLWLLVVPPFVIHFFQFLLEYFLPQLLFIIIPITFSLFKNKSSFKILFFLVIVIILTYFLKCILHSVAGFFWWTPNNWIASLLINARIIGINLVIQLPITLILLNVIIRNYDLSLLIFQKSFAKRNNSDFL